MRGAIVAEAGGRRNDGGGVVNVGGKRGIHPFCSDYLVVSIVYPCAILGRERRQPPRLARSHFRLPPPSHGSTIYRIDTPFSMPTLAIPLKDILTDATSPADPVALLGAEAIAYNNGSDGLHLPEPQHTRRTPLEKS